MTGVRRLVPDDAPAFVALRREALEHEPLAFAASLDDDHALALDFVRTGLAEAPDRAVFGAFHGPDLVGMVGLRREARLKLRHTATIWGMYVSARARGRGAGRALLEAAIAHARAWPDLDHLQLAVSETATAARRLYASAGFRPWGTEPRAFSWRGRYVDSHHMVLALRD